jgi:hypothetical protein
MTALKETLHKNLIAIELCGAAYWEGGPISHTVNLTLTDGGRIIPHRNQTIVEAIFSICAILSAF